MHDCSQYRVAARALLDGADRRGRSGESWALMPRRSAIIPNPGIPRPLESGRPRRTKITQLMNGHETLLRSTEAIGAD
jgi:hypothetical protein